MYDLEPSAQPDIGQGAAQPIPRGTPPSVATPKSTGIPVVGSPASRPQATAFVKPGLGSAQVIALVGAGVALSAVIVSAVYAGQRGERWLPAAVWTLYSTLLHSATGVVAVMIVASATRAKAGDLILACARMLLAVGAFMLVSNLDLPVPGPIGETTLACAVYIGVVWGFFRWRPEVVGSVATVHATIWFIIYAASILHVWRLTPVSMAPGN